MGTQKDLLMVLSFDPFLMKCPGFGLHHRPEAGAAWTMLQQASRRVSTHYFLHHPNELMATKCSGKKGQALGPKSLGVII